MLAHLAKVAQEKAGEQRLEAAKSLNKPIEDWEVELALQKSHSGRPPGPGGLRTQFFREAYVLVPAGCNGRDCREVQSVTYPACFTEVNFLLWAVPRSLVSCCTDSSL